MSRKFLRSLTTAMLLGLGTKAAASPLLLTDMTGRQVALSEPATRIVTTYMPASILSLSLGLGDNLVGVSSQDNRQSLVRKLLGQRSPTQVGNLTAGINLETVLALKPDLVLISDKKDGARLADQLAQLKVPALLIRAESLPQIEQALTLIATAAGNPAEAERVIDASRALQQELSQRLTGVTPVRGYYGNGGDLYRSVGKSMFQHDLLTKAGIDNVAADVAGFYPKINLEQLLTWAPQYLVLEQGRGERISEQLAEPQLMVLKDVPRTTLPSDALWHMPTPLAAASAYYVASQVHPQRFNDVNVADRLGQFYQQVVGDACTAPFENSLCRH
ncbi:ABC transporter substrate-binding protein [Ferrimonas senticii]|uniref:ABC transporter substrate-binding protein n=1 Tax=Ferrimonas senticii TaxID=394566 RepID=UPI0004209A42|nr:ABC transporter substrate-binding protein [Ferrimonas senticii]